MREGGGSLGRVSQAHGPYNSSLSTYHTRVQAIWRIRVLPRDMFNACVVAMRQSRERRAGSDRTRAARAARAATFPLP